MAIHGLKITLLVILTTVAFSNCGEKIDDAIKEVIIGEQIWMATNLNVERFRNGDLIPQVKTNEEWLQAGKKEEPAWCYFDNNPNLSSTHGKLYNWYAVTDPRGLAPKGWHIPTSGEWAKLANYLGGEEIAGRKMKSQSGWSNGGNGNNESGFSGYPSGLRFPDGTFDRFGKYGYWWSLDENSDYVYCRYLIDNDDYFVYSNEFREYTGFSVRCIRD